MGRISASIGLITGLPIRDTVDQLIALQGRPRDFLRGATVELSQRQFALSDLAARLISLQVTAKQFALTESFSEHSVSSSDPSVLDATVTGDVAPGDYQFTPLRQVQAQQFLSSRLVSDTAPLGTGSFSFRFGGALDDDIELANLNGGDGFDRGHIRITDRSGASAVIDLTLARGVDDVLAQINANDQIRVTATAVGDSFRLVDETGLTLSNLRVEEVGGGGTAASLGLAGVDVAASQVDGADVLRLFNDFSLSLLGDGAGIQFDEDGDDLEITLASGEKINVDFRFAGVEGTHPAGTTSATEDNARVRFTAVEAGSAAEGTIVQFKDDGGLSGGDERVFYDETARTLTIFISEGETTADDVIAALDADEAASALFTASTPDAQFGNGLVLLSHNTVIGPPQATAFVNAANEEGRLDFTAVVGGQQFDGVTIHFVDNAGITRGNETVVYDEVAKTLTFQIDDGFTTGDHIIAALDNDPLAGAVFTAKRADGANGAGHVRVGDSDAQTAGGAIVEPVPAGNELTIGDLLATINAAGDGKFDARIAADGERIILRDNTVGTTTFQVRQLTDSTVADALGLGDAVGNEISGGRLISGLKTTLLSSLNGGRGLGTLGNLILTDRSNTTSIIDLSTAETLDDIIELVNSAQSGIVASINRTQNGLLLSDVTGQAASNLIVANGGGGAPAADLLGITADTDQTTVVGSDLHLQTVSQNTLLGSLNGGRGVAAGTITIFDSEGRSAALVISADEDQTIGDLIHDITNRLGLSINARINDAGDGIAIVSTVVVEDLQGLGTIDLTDRSGATASVDLSSVTERQDVIDLINAAGVGISATANGAGHGIILTDTTGSTAGNLIVSDADASTTATRLNLSIDAATFTVDSGDLHLAELQQALRVDEGGGTTAADLHLLGGEVEIDEGGTLTKAIVGSTTVTISIDEDESLRDLVDKINDLGAGISASLFNDGSLSRPYRLTLTGDVPGKAGEVIIDTSGINFSLEQTAEARDALLLFGVEGAADGGLLISSSTNTFDEVVGGLSLSAKQTSDKPVSIRVEQVSTTITATAIAFVNTFNGLRGAIEGLTAFNADTNETGLLQGEGAILRIESDLANLLTGRLFGVGSIKTLREIGIDFTSKGRLEFDESIFASKFEQDPRALKQFLTSERLGFAAKIDQLLEQLAGSQNSLLVNRTEALSRRIDANNLRIDFLNERLEASRVRLTESFVRAELAIGKIQGDLAAISAFQALPALTTNLRTG